MFQNIVDKKGTHISHQYTLPINLIDIIKQKSIKTPKMLCVHLLACFMFLIIFQEHLPTMQRGGGLKTHQLQSMFQIVCACVKPPMNETQDANIILIYCSDVLCIYSAMKKNPKMLRN